MARERTQTRHTVPFTTSLHPAAAAALAALADREPDGHASGVISRLVRAELDRLVPGAWDAAMRVTIGLTVPDVPHWDPIDHDMGTIEGRRAAALELAMRQDAARTAEKMPGTPAERASAAAKVIRDALGRARFG